jgi:hypothetical protein
MIECDCGFRCKVCGAHTHEVLQHYLAPWHTVIECVCERCRQWVVDVVRNDLVALLNSPGGLAKVIGLPGR